jgi:hypothetical protein
VARTATKVHRRLPNPRRVKMHRNYSVEEAAATVGVHKNSIREWLRHGLHAMRDQRPLLILGHDLKEFLVRRRQANKRPCQPGEIYCVRCRVPQRPAGGIADYQPITATLGNLVGMCPHCEAMIHRRVSAARLSDVKGELDVRVPQAQEHIDESAQASVNCDFKRE